MITMLLLFYMLLSMARSCKGYTLGFLTSLQKLNDNDAL